MLGMAKNASSAATRIPREHRASQRHSVAGRHYRKNLNVFDITAGVVSRDSDDWDHDNVRDLPAAG